MVAIVSGMRLGLELGSLATLGNAGIAGRAAHGQAGEGVYVNAATGNLVLQRQDELLAATGQDVTALRTYNSQGTFSQDDHDWREGVESVRLAAGSLNTAGSTLERTGRDGSVAVYTFDAASGRYLTTEGGGAYDTIRWFAAAGQLEWCDGDTGLTQRYEAGGLGRLLWATDPGGANKVSYEYQDAASFRLARIATGDGTAVLYDYEGTHLKEVRSVAADGATSLRVRYAYDTAGRLASVTVDLSPADRSIADGQTYVTGFTYVGDSDRIRSMSQADGTLLLFTYDGDRVASVTDALGHTTSFAYGLRTDGSVASATVTDAAGAATTYKFDTQGQVLSIEAPSGGDVTRVQRFSYTALGDVDTVTDGAGNQTVFRYDPRGNLVFQRDAAGNTVRRSYDDANQLLGETLYTDPDPDGEGAAQPTGALVTRYVYAANDRHQLRFEISAQGRVTEHRYDAFGQRKASIVWAGGTYDLSGLGATGMPGYDAVADWVTQQDPTRCRRVDMTYLLGQLSTRTTYASVTAQGQGVADSTASVTQYVYDTAGRLLQAIEPGNRTTTYAYDGLGRTWRVTNALGQRTVTDYVDAERKIRVTLANGLVSTSVYDRAGRVHSVVQSDGIVSEGGQSLGNTRYFYDAADRLTMTVDPTGVRSWILYDAAGRKAADIDGNGTMTEYRYDAADRLVRVKTWAQAVNLAKLVDADGNPLRPAVVDLGLTPSSNDHTVWRQYDSAGRLQREAETVGIDGRAAVTETLYDGASRVVGTVRYAGTVDAASIDAGAPGRIPQPSTTNAANRVTRNFYNKDGLLAGTLDAAGYLVTYSYNAAGQLSEKLAYANATDPALRAEGTLADLLPGASPDNIREVTLYDGKGQRIAVVDGEKYLTEFRYDERGNLGATLRYAARVTKAVDGNSKLAEILPADTTARVATRSYDDLGRLATETSPEGVVTKYTYDARGNLLSTQRAAGTAEVRTTRAKYDLQGRVVAELGGEGSARLVGDLSADQVDAIWRDYGVSHTYDDAGRRTSTRDAAGNVTWFYYDEDGALRFTIDALGQVRERRYDVLGRLTREITYATTTAVRGPGGLLTASLAPAPSWQDDDRRYSYTTDGRVFVATDAEGRTRTSSYNAFGDETQLVQQLSDGVDLTETRSYDRRGQRTHTESDPAGAKVVADVEYDAFGRAVRTIDGNRNVRTQTYDRLGRMLATVDPLGGQRSTVYDAFGRTLTETDALGNATTYSYDDQARKVTVTSPGGVVTSTQRNRHGEVSVTVNGNLASTTYTYDRNGALTSRADAACSETREYDNAGRLWTTTDAAGRKVRYEYDPANRVFRETVDPDGLSLVTLRTFDAKGQVIRVTDPSGDITEYRYRPDGQLWMQTVDPDGLALRTTYSHDASGNVLSVTPPTGAKTVYIFDALGRRTSETVDPDGLKLTRSWAYDDNGNVLTSVDANGKLTRFVVDAADRLVYTVDPTGGVQKLEYDAEGRVTRSVRFATAINLVGLDVTPSTLDVARLIAPDRAHDAQEYRGYDADGRLSFTVDGRGAVVKFRYDGNGNCISRVAYATPIDLASWVAGTPPPVVGSRSQDQRLDTLYDAANRAIYTVDALGAVVATTYDGTGKLLLRRAYATTIAPPPALRSYTRAELESAVAAVADAQRDATLRQAYDAAGRLVISVDALGAVTKTEYDGAGRVVARTAHANRISQAGLADDASLGTLNRRLQPSDVGDRTTRYAYDAAGRLVTQQDASGTATTMVYDKAGRMLSRAVAGRTESWTYNAAGQALTWTDPAGAKESYKLDALGQRLALTDRNGATWTYTYDAAGRKVSETSPSVASTITSIDDTGTVVAAAVAAEGIVTTFTYDALGQLVRRVEAAGRDEQRTTLYDYDASGHQVLIDYGNVRVYDPARDSNVASNGATGVALRRETLRHLVVRTWYDALGNAVANLDVGGALSQKTYDAAGRLRHEVDALGYVTAYDRNAFGDVTALTRYAGATNLAARTVTGVADAVTAAQVEAKLATAAMVNAGSRTVQTFYDRAGRVVEVRQPAAFFYDATTGQGTRASARTCTTYNAFGEAVEVRQARDAAGSDWVTTTHYFDPMGREVGTVDALGYFTRRTYDAAGNLVEVKEYATAIATSWDSASHQMPAPSADDRTVRYEYDAVGRKTAEWRIGVAYSTTPDGAAPTTGNLVTRFAYDGLGNQVSVTNALGNITATRYDAFSRVTAVASLKTGTDLNPLTIYRRDALGNVVGETQYANGADPTSTFKPLAASGADRVTLRRYDLLGRVIATTDAMGNTAYASYDAYGHVAKSWQGATGLDGVTRTVFEVNRYDALGQLVETRTPASTMVVRSGVTASVTAPALDDMGTVGPFTLKLTWSDIVNAAGRKVRVEVSYMTVAKTVVFGDTPQTIDSQLVTETCDYAASSVGGGLTFTASQSADSLVKIRVTQLQDDNTWQVKWEGTPGTANGSGVTIVAQQQAGLVVASREYNAFGELTRQGTQGDWQEYWDYDEAGRLWRTNSGDGIDRIQLYDLLGNKTAEIRSAGSGRGDQDLRSYQSAADAAADPTTRRTETTYDALGHVTSRQEAARKQSEGGVKAVRQYLRATVTSATWSANGVNGEANWSGANAVKLSWSDVSALGAGDVKIWIDYRTAANTARTYKSDILSQAGLGTGATLTWAEASQTQDGGVGDIDRIRVWKKDINGDWQLVVDQPAGYGGVELQVDAPADTRSSVVLNLRPAGTSTWTAVALANFGDGYRYDASGLAPGAAYDYEVRVTPPGGTEDLVATGSVTITLPGLQKIPVTLSYQPTLGPGVLAWTTQPDTTQQVLNYRLKGTTDAWQTLPVLPWEPSTGSFGGTTYDAVDTHLLAAGTYQFELLWNTKDASGTWLPSAHATGSFTTNPGTGSYSVVVNSVPSATAISTDAGATATQATGQNGLTEWVRPIVYEKSDRWGNVLERTDPRSVLWKTTYKYNAANQVVQQVLPRVSATAATTNIFYDALGRQVAVRDANDHVSGQRFDAFDHLVTEIQANGGTVTHGYNAFGEKVQTVDALGNSVSFGYDRMGRMTSTVKGSAVVAKPDANMVVTTTDPVAITERWTYDELGRRTSATNGAGEKTSYVFDARGDVMQTILPYKADADRVVTSDAFDAQGRKVAELDANGVVARWTYDYFGQLVDHVDLGGARYTYTYDHARQLVAQTNTRGQKLAYGYDAAGQLTRITDSAINQQTTYAYDDAGRRIRERTVQAGVTYQDNHLGYDAVGNLRDVADARVHMTLTYDLVGNRTKIYTSVDYQGLTKEVRSITTRFFAYDAMNWQTKVDGVDADNPNLLPTGHLITYDKAGNRLSDQAYRIAVKRDASGAWVKTTDPVLVTDNYAYDSLNRLTKVTRTGINNATPIVIDERLYDAADRVVRSGSTSLTANYIKALRTDLKEGESDGQEIRINRYDVKGRMLDQRVMKSNNTDVLSDVTWDPNDKWIYAGFDPSTGAVMRGPKGYDGVGNAIGYVVRSYQGGTTTQEFTTTLARFESHQASKVEGTSSSGSIGKTVQGYDKNGFLVSVDDTTQDANDCTLVNDATGKTLFVNRNGNVQRTLIVNGEMLGVYGVMVDPDKPLQDGNPNFKNLADFQFGYAPITSSYPNASPGAYTVRTGDTLQTIAQSAYGDSALWFRIAEANGLASSNDLKVGQALNIPNRVSTLHNNSSTFEPYDPGKVVGDVSPNMAAPKDDCGAVGRLLALVVAVVVTTYAGPVFGNIASQAVAVGTGAQEDFSWKSVAISAVGSFVSQFTPIAQIGDSVVRAVVANAVTQGISVAAGLQDRFDWRGVAAAGAGAAAGQFVGAQLGLPADGSWPTGMSRGDYFARTFGKALVAGAATALARGGRVAVEQVFVDAFGNALAGSLVSTPVKMPSAQGGRAWSEEGYVNELDLQSDEAYKARRAQEWTAQSDSNQNRRLHEISAANAQDNFRATERAYSQEVETARQVNGLDLPSDYKFPQQKLLSDADLERARTQILSGEASMTRATSRSVAWTGEAGAGRGLVNPADAVLHSAAPFAGRSTVTDPAAYAVPKVLNALDAAKASIAIEKELQSVMRMQPNSTEGWAARIKALDELSRNYQVTMRAGGLEPDVNLVTTVAFQQSIATYHLDGDMSGMAGTALATGVILGMQNVAPGIAKPAAVGATRTVSAAGGGAVDLELKYKPDWTPEQRAEADAKVKFLTEAPTVVTTSDRSGTSAAVNRYRRADSVRSGVDVDHMQDLQLGGSKEVDNLWKLNSSVNRSLGVQIQQQIRNLPLGTPINRVTIK